MTFPSTPLLDDLNRPDEGPPPGPNWVDGVYGNSLIMGGYWKLQLINNMASFVGPDGGGAFWHNLMPANFEAWFVIGAIEASVLNTSTFAMNFRQANNVIYDDLFYFTVNGGPASGTINYTVQKSISGVWSFPLSNSFNGNLNIGDTIGLRVIDDLIQIWYTPVGGSATLIDSVVDTDLSGPGYVSIEVDRNYITPDSNGAIDSFGGGVPEVAPPNNPQEAIMAVPTASTRVRRVSYHNSVQPVTVTAYFDDYLNTTPTTDIAVLYDHSPVDLQFGGGLLNISGKTWSEALNQWV